MAEQAGRQEQKQEAKAERPQVRRVKLSGEVFIPDAQTLGGTNGKAEIDFEGRTALTHCAAAEIGRLGVLVRYKGIQGQRQAPMAVLVPWHMVTRVDLAPEWKP